MSEGDESAPPTPDEVRRRMAEAHNESEADKKGRDFNPFMTVIAMLFLAVAAAPFIRIIFGLLFGR